MGKKLRIIKLPYQKEGIWEGTEERRGISPGPFLNLSIYVSVLHCLFSKHSSEIHVPVYMDPEKRGLFYCSLAFLHIWYCFYSKISLRILGKQKWNFPPGQRTEAFVRQENKICLPPKVGKMSFNFKKLKCPKTEVHHHVCSFHQDSVDKKK